MSGRTRTHSVHAELHTHSTAYLAWIDQLWSRRRIRARKYALAHRAVTVGHQALWLCIHSREGAWTDTGDPYWGGLQMTPGWYGGHKHHASDDPPAVQMAAAERQYRASGYSVSWLEGQWPNTSPPCLAYR